MLISKALQLGCSPGPRAPGSWATAAVKTQPAALEQRAIAATLGRARRTTRQQFLFPEELEHSFQQSQGRLQPNRGKYVRVRNSEWGW
eukprot:363882-Chlamydomonas_euryale.AAC.2